MEQVHMVILMLSKITLDKYILAGNPKLNNFCYLQAMEQNLLNMVSIPLIFSTTLSQIIHEMLNYFQ